MTEPPATPPADPPADPPAPAPKPKKEPKPDPTPPSGGGVLAQLAELPKLIRSEIDSALDERMRVNEPEPKGDPAPPEPKGDPAPGKDDPPHKKSIAERLGF